MFKQNCIYEETENRLIPKPSLSHLINSKILKVCMWGIWLAGTLTLR